MSDLSDVQEEGRGLFEKVRDAIRLHFAFEQPWHYDIATLFVMQAKLAPVLPACFYLFPSGPRGSGKSRFLKFAAKLTGGLTYENVSVPALVRQMKYGRLVCLDEADANRGQEFLEVRDALLRGGYQSDSPPYVRWNPKGNRAEEFPVFGPRAVVGAVDGALKDRGFTIPTIRVKGRDGYDLVRRNFRQEVHGLPSELDEWSERATKTYSVGQVEGMMFSKEFEERIGTVIEVGGDRGSELATIALLVADICGVDIASSLRQANELRTTVADDSMSSDIELLQDVVASKVPESVRDAAVQTDLQAGQFVRVEQREIRAEFDRQRKDKGEWQRMSDAKFAELRRAIGISDGWLVEREHRKVWHIPWTWLPGLPRLRTLHMEEKESGEPRETPKGMSNADPNDPRNWTMSGLWENSATCYSCRETTRVLLMNRTDNEGRSRLCRPCLVQFGFFKGG